MSFLHGFLLAFGLILPLGVQNTFIFNQGAVQKKFRQVLPAILTATLCDMTLILISVLGVAVVVMNVSVVQYVLLIAGIAFLIYMGWVTWRSAEASQKSEAEVAVSREAVMEASDGATGGSSVGTPVNEGLLSGPLSAKKQIIFATSVSLLNPHAILDTIGVIGTSSLQYGGWDKIWFTVACILVSFVWFLSLAAAALVGKINSKIIPLINKCSALIMWGSAVYLATSFLNL